MKSLKLDTEPIVRRIPGDAGERPVGLSFRVCRAVLTVSSIALVSVLCSCPRASEVSPGVDVYVRDVSGGIHETTPVRGVRGPLALHRDGDGYECTMCHLDFDEVRRQEALEGEHADITFSHGRNVLCLNCHNASNPDVYIGDGDVEIANDQPSELCSKCHGPHYREWNLGVHGRFGGYWDPDAGPQTRLDCIQCHNPHAPHFELMTPEPPPVLTRFDLDTQGATHHE